MDMPTEDPYKEGDSRNKQTFYDNHMSHRYPKVDMNKFDGFEPSQMEHYFTLHGINNDMMKLRVGVLYLDVE
jgi:hypothetical protein